MKKTTTTDYIQTTGLTFDIAIKQYKEYENWNIIDKSIPILSLWVEFIAEDGSRKRYYRQHAIIDTDCIKDLSLDLNDCKARIEQDEFNKYNWWNIKKLLNRYIDDMLITDKR